MDQLPIGPRQWARIQELFLDAVELPAEDRAAFLLRAERDPEVRAQVLSLLESDADPATVLEGSADDLLPRDGPSGGLAPDGEEAERSDPRVGTRIGPYRCRSRIAAGGMGAVYLAEHVEFEQRVALKLVRRGMDTDEIVRRFAAERQILARLQHPNIARLLDGGITDDGLPWFSMEYVDGKPITEYCRGLPVRARLALFLSVCQAVHYAHQNLVVHRDLKPGNIMVTPDGVVKLLDFGIAKVVSGDAADQDAGLTRTGLRPMSPAYAAPEQVLGEPVTTASDVYALGVLLYEIVTGRRPYGDDLSPTQLERAILTADPPPPSSRAGRGRRAFSKDLDNIVLEALRKEPARRYVSVSALSADIGRYLSGHPVTASRDSATYRLRKFVRRHRTGVTAAAAVLTLLSATVTWYTGRLRAERDRAGREAEKFAAINNYFRLVFEQASPLRDTGGGTTLLREPTITDLLDWAAEHAEEQLSDYPEAHAQALQTLGYILRTRGDYARAEPLLRAAIDVKSQILGDSVDDAIVMITSNVGNLLTGMGRYEEAEQFFRTTLELAYGYPEYNGYGVAFGLNNLAKHLTRMGRYEEAEPYLVEALEVYEDLVGEHHQFRAITLGNHARLLWASGRLEKIDSIFAQSLADKRAVWTEGDLSIAEDLYSMSWLRRLEGRSTEALAIADSALSMRRLILRDDRSELGASMQQHGLLLVEAGKIPEGLDEVRAGDQLFRAEAEPGHPRTYEGALHLGMALRLAGRGDEARSSLLQAVQEADAHLPPGHPAAADPRMELGLLDMDRGRWAEAERWLREALAIREKRLRDGHWRTARARGALGRSLLQAGDPATAEPLLTAAYATLRSELGETHPCTAEVANTLDLLAAGADGGLR
jgi:serine/threonine-protein kinase